MGEPKILQKNKQKIRKNNSQKEISFFKHRTRSSISSIVREMQIKVTLRYVSNPSVWQKIKSLTVYSVIEVVGKHGLINITSGNTEGLTPRRGIWQYLTKLLTYLSFDLKNATSRNLPERYIHTPNSTTAHMQNVIHYRIICNFKALKTGEHPHIGDGMNELWCIHTRSCSSAIKKEQGKSLMY